MKKLTWALLSLMLFLGLGTAFAQDVTVPALALDPASGSTVTPGKVITPVGDDECLTLLMQGKFVYAMYIWDDVSVVLTATEDLMTTSQGEGEAAYKVAMWTPNEDMDAGFWMPDLKAPEAAGSHTLRVRLVAAPPLGGLSAQAKAGGFDDAAYTYGEEITANYTVAGEAVVEPVEAPELSPAGGAVDKDSKVNFVYDEMPMHYCYYVIDNPDFDFSAIEHMDDIPETLVMDMNGWVKVTEAMTITVAICRVNMEDGSIAAWSEPVTGSYTIKPVAPAAPVFNPNRGEVTLDQQIS